MVVKRIWWATAIHQVLLPIFTISITSLLQIDSNSPIFSAKLPTILIHQTFLLPKFFTIQYSYLVTHTYMHTYIHTCIHTYIHTCIHTHTQTYIRICTCIHAYTVAILHVQYIYNCVAASAINSILALRRLATLHWYILKYLLHKIKMNEFKVLKNRSCQPMG